MQVYINNLKPHIGEEVIVKGWLYNKRSKGKIRFLIVRDGTGFVQCVASKNDVSEKVFEECDKIPQESSLTLKGLVREDKRAPSGVEITLKDLCVIHKASSYPIQIQDVVPDVGFLMDNRHLWIRSKKQHSTLKIRAEVIKAIRTFLDTNGFVCIDTPILTPTSCEETSTLFEVNYFDDKVYLTQSGQLYAEAGALAFGKAYCFGPTFRAEKSKTRKHLTEFWMVEPEVAYLDFEGLLKLIEDFLSSVVQSVLERCKNELKTLGRDTNFLRNVLPPFPRISYDDAVKVLNQKGEKFAWGEDFGAPHEEVISKNFDKPVMIHHYPVKCKAFYMQPDSKDSKYSLSVDVIATEGYGEIIGGSERISDLNLLEQRIDDHKLPKDAFKWYLDLRRYGTVVHSGFGLGIERLVAWLCGSTHIRECIPFARTIYRIYP